MTNPSNAQIDVLVCTYKRNKLLIEALDGIERAAIKVGRVRIIVVDNEGQRGAEGPVREWAERANVEVLYLSQPRQNISLTRNMALDHATAPWIAFLDDDETPDPDWLANLVAAAERYEADVVFGPVISVFDGEAPKWAKEGKVFQRRRYASGSEMPVRAACTGNLMMRGSRFARDQFRFDPELGLSGGEDSEFFGRLSRAGYRLVWTDDAPVYEGVPKTRTTISWIVKRAFRVGSVDAYNKRRFRRYGEAVVAAVKAGVFLVVDSVLALVWAPISTPRSIYNVFRVALAAGYFYGLVAGPYTEYRTRPVRAKGVTQ